MSASTCTVAKDSADWRARKKESLQRVKRLVVKVGSAVLTGPEGIDPAVIHSLASQIAALHKLGVDTTLVTSGAVAAGRAVLARMGADQPCPTRVGSLPDRQAASSIGQSRLMAAYDEAFARFGIVTAQMLLTRSDLESRERFLNVRNTFSALLSRRCLPIVNENDAVAVQELVFGDNDSLAGLLVGVVEADLLVNLTSAVGVMSANPAEDENARLLSVIEDIDSLALEHMCKGKTNVGTGGMYSKLLSARRAASLCVPTLIAPGREPEALVRVFGGEDVGTWIAPKACAISRRKFWLAYSGEAKGEIWIDAGASEALRAKGKSLLAAGIIRIVGDFEAGALVRLLDFQGQTVGVGLVNYDSGSMRKIMGLKSDRFEEALGLAPFPEAVHRDNLLLDPAL